MASQLLSAVGQPSSAQLPSECRVYERQSCALPTTCQPASALEMKELRWPATISDISQGGVRITLQRRFEKGAGLAIELPGNSERESSVVFVKVVHLKSRESGGWILGCRFLSELSDDELQYLLTSTSHVLSSSKKECRVEETTGAGSHSTPRILPDVHFQIETAPGSYLHCIVKRLDVSKCWPLAPEKFFRLKGVAQNKKPWSYRIQLIRWTAQGQGWLFQGRILTPCH
jgi:hypothetical protein